MHGPQNVKFDQPLIYAFFLVGVLWIRTGVEMGEKFGWKLESKWSHFGTGTRVYIHNMAILRMSPCVWERG
jgi:hypothetical protein